MAESRKDFDRILSIGQECIEEEDLRSLFVTKALTKPKMNAETKKIGKR